MGIYILINLLVEFLTNTYRPHEHSVSDRLILIMNASNNFALRKTLINNTQQLLILVGLQLFLRSF